MKKYCIVILAAAFLLSLIPDLPASSHRHSKHDRRRNNDGLALAAGIVHLIRTVVETPQPSIVAPPPAKVKTIPVVVTPRRPVRPVVLPPAPRRHHQRHSVPRRRPHMRRYR